MKRAFKIFIYFFKAYLFIVGGCGIAPFFEHFFNIDADNYHLVITLLIIVLFLAVMFEYLYITSSVSKWHAHPATIAFSFLPYSILSFFTAIFHVEIMNAFHAPKLATVIVFIISLLLSQFLTNLRIIVRHPGIFPENRDPLFKNDTE